MKNKISLTDEQKHLRANPPQSLMAVNSQGNLALDRQFEAANNLHDVLEEQRKGKQTK